MMIIEECFALSLAFTRNREPPSNWRVRAEPRALASLRSELSSWKDAPFSNVANLPMRLTLVYASRLTARKINRARQTILARTCVGIFAQSPWRVVTRQKRQLGRISACSLAGARDSVLSVLARAPPLARYAPMPPYFA